MKSEVDAVLAKDSEITVFDFETEEVNKEYEYWYCPVCKRVHMVENIPLGKVVKSYITSQENMDATEEMTPFYVFTDTEIYNAEEEDFKLKLADFVSANEDTHMYFLSREKDKVYKKEDGKLNLVYLQE